jgi:acyl-phosphate glycerol 3-phosphate acyltransferase
MTSVAITAIVILIAYLIGAVPFGYLVGRWRGVDIFHEGSGNIGATNVGRVLGRRFGILVFLLDFAKGAGPALAAKSIPLPEDSFATALGTDGLGVAAGLSAFLGHLFPIYLRFHGGKGVATGAGVVTVLLPGPALGALLTWILILGASRYVSLASLGAATVLCALRIGLTAEPFGTSERILTLFCLVTMAMVFVRHRANISRLVHGNENQLRDTPAMFVTTKILHVMAMGLWFGMTIFFTFVVGLSLFNTFEKISEKPGIARERWFPLPKEFDAARPSEQFPEPLRKEQGSRAFGAAVGPLFPWYYGIQAACGLVALAMTLSWPQSSRRVHKVRKLLVALAFLSVAAGWQLEQKVEEVRVVRDNTCNLVFDDLAVPGKSPNPERVEAASQARKEFGRWHGYSLMTNLVTVLLVGVAMSLTAVLPTREVVPVSKSTSSGQA